MTEKQVEEFEGMLLWTPRRLEDGGVEVVPDSEVVSRLVAFVDQLVAAERWACQEIVKNSEPIAFGDLSKGLSDMRFFVSDVDLVVEAMWKRGSDAKV